ncbi:unnamed protein product [Moneuplotes crassus]|uniref:CH-like domain-containing protein n=1 Tax=Euplotes crassus TaxID=5936 RepID=A0AAD1XIR7_EUPCR|nr:unnamed protein product [Moneuplotes crassus]
MEQSPYRSSPKFEKEMLVTPKKEQKYNNGYLAAEILNQYYPDQISLRDFENTQKYHNKLKNWAQINKILNQLKLPIEMPDLDLLAKNIDNKIAQSFVHDLSASLKALNLKKETDKSYYSPKFSLKKKSIKFLEEEKGGSLSKLHKPHIVSSPEILQHHKFQRPIPSDLTGSPYHQAKITSLIKQIPIGAMELRKRIYNP